MRIEAEEILREHVWLASIGEPLKSRLLSLGRWVHLEPGDPLYMAGEDNGGLMGVASGTVFSRVSNAPSDVAMTDLHRSPFWTLSRAIVPGEERVVTAVAQTRVTAVRIPQAAVFLLMQEHPEMVLHLLRNVANVFARMALVAGDALLRNHAERLTAVLLRVGECRLDGSASVEVPIGQQDLAGMANLSRQKTSEVLRDMEQNGLVALGYRRITILEPDRLRTLLES